MAEKDKDSRSKDADKPPDTDEDDRIAKISFCCSSCGQHEMLHFFGKQPPFVYAVEFVEPTYVMRDPFQAPPPRGKRKAEYFVAIGAHCQSCNAMVCKDAACSFFYKSTFCLPCAAEKKKENGGQWPQSQA